MLKVVALVQKMSSLQGQNGSAKGGYANGCTGRMFDEAVLEEDREIRYLYF